MSFDYLCSSSWFITSTKEVREVYAVTAVSVCLFVCLSVSEHRIYLKKLLTDLKKILWKGVPWTKEDVIKFCD